MKFKVFRFKKVKSTNNTAIRIIRNSKLENGMIISELQSDGRGQYGRRWISEKGNLFVSLFYIQNNLYLTLKQLTKINSFLVKKLLAKYYKKKIDLKKPNDLLINKKKICGILQENIDKLDKKYLIVGIGINLIKSPSINNYPTTNLYDLIKKKISKKKVEMDLKQIFENKFKSLINKKK
tara:strand:+ start:1691 stop:2230 length:540 start_codon:yes stop_codon:yes gene_type:complete